MLGEKYVTREALSNYVTNETFQREQKDLRTFIMQTMGVGIGACALMMTAAVFFVNLSFSTNYRLLDSRIAILDARISGLESSVKALDGRMTVLETRMTAIESRVGQLEATMTAKFDVVFSRLSSIERRIDRVELRLDRLDGGAATAGPARPTHKQ